MSDDRGIDRGIKAELAAIEHELESDRTALVLTQARITRNRGRKRALLRQIKT